MMAARVKPPLSLVRFGPLIMLVVLSMGPIRGFAQSDQATLANAPIRLRLERNAGSPWPAAVGVAEIAPCLNAPSRFGVFTADGKPVASQTLWSAPGEMTRVRFAASSGADVYYVCFDDKPFPDVGSWKPEAGVVLETRPCASGLPIDTFAHINQLIGAAGPPMGRGYVPNVFLGLNPFGPSQYYLATFTGWFQAPKTDVYSFATTSDDASYLEVDGHLVAQFLGTHDAGGGRRGEHNGVIRLQEGLHQLQYVQIQLDGASAAVAAWKPPGQGRFEVMPQDAFAPVAHFHVTRFESAPSLPRQCYFEWQSHDQCAIANSIAVSLRFHAVDQPPRRTCRWRFDDGDEVTGANARHFFARLGQRQVTLQVVENGVVLAANSARVHVEPNWSQLNWWREPVFEEARADFLRRDLTRAPARDLEDMLEFADRAEDAQLLSRGGQAFVARADEFNTPAHGILFYKVGVHFQRQGDWGDALAEKSLRLALSPERNVAAVAEKVKLRLANLLIHYDGNLDEAETILGEISGNGLLPEEKRLWKLVRGDLLLARGRIDEARKQYLSVGSPESGRFDAPRDSRLLGASVLLERGEFDEAQQALDSLLLDFPLERMSLDAGLPRLDLALKRKAFQRALTEGNALLPLAEGSPRQSEILRVIVESALALGKAQQAQQALSRLLKDFPSSESAAKAKDLWNSRRQ